MAVAGAVAGIDYDALVQEAMRGVVRAVLLRVVKEGGLPGEHHFYISFNTRAHGVGLSKRLREKYPEEMTVVLQHRFWELAVYDDRFEVKLTFDAIPERLVVPFSAIKVFVDPSVRFGHQFEEPDAYMDEPTSSNDMGGAASGRTGGRSLRATEKKRPSPRRPQRTERARDETDEPEEASSAAADAASKPLGKAGEPIDSAKVEPVADPGPKVVSLDKFRKK
jgi:hypothetical protein